MISNQTTLLQLDRRKEEIAAIYNLASVGYDQSPLNFFSLAAARLVEYLKIQPGQQILDIGTGTGIAAILAAKDCAPNGRVTGIDIATEMLKVAAHKVATGRIANLELQLGDGESLSFTENSFDLVLGAAAIFFLSDMLAGLKEWKRVCKPGGQVAITGFGINAFQPMSDMFEELIRRYGVTFPVQRHPFSWQRLAEPGQYLDLLTQAGYYNIEVHTEQLGYYLPMAEEWWQLAWNSGFRGPLSRLDPLQLDRFKAEHLNQIAPLAGPEGIWLELPVIFAWGYKP